VSDCAVGQTGGGGARLNGNWVLSLAADHNEDMQYLTLGTWLSLPDSADGEIDVGSFANGSAAFTPTALAALTGTARYMGPATGIYSAGHVGSFVARAELDADFGAAGVHPTVEGRIHQFRENGERLGNWNLLLDQVNLASSNQAGVSGRADGRDFEGNWNLGFYDDGTARTPGHPGYAAGTFNAATGDALRIVGAFGADLQQ